MSISSSPLSDGSTRNLPWQVAALYHFTRFEDPAALRGEVLKECLAHDICGSLLLAGEGINGTIAGREEHLRQIVAWLRKLPGCEDMEVKYSAAHEQPFARMKVKLKREIVTMGVEGVDPVGDVGTYVEPKDWNALLSRPDMILIDTRNDYEVGIGTFEGAINPHIATFREFPGWFADMQKQWEEEGKAPPPVAMFCTGGIRCEKSTALARKMGLDEVYHLKGGILKYLEEVPEEKSKWQGHCFVFDERVSVGHGLTLTDDQMCQQCGHPFGAGEEHHCDADRPNRR